MDASELSNIELEILDRVFRRFDQGDTYSDLDSSWDNEEAQKRVYSAYNKMFHDIVQESLQRKLAASAEGMRYQIYEKK